MLEDQLRQIFETFKTHEGKVLSQVWTQHESMTPLSTERDRLPTEHVRIIFDFTDKKGEISSVYLRFAVHEGILNVAHSGRRTRNANASGASKESKIMQERITGTGPAIGAKVLIKENALYPPQWCGPWRIS